MAIQTFILSDPDSGEPLTFLVMNVNSAVNQQWGEDDSRITVVYKIPWAKRFLARKLLLGETKRAINGLGQVFLARTVPHRWIEPEASKLFARKITDTKGLGTVTQPDCYIDAELTVMYQDLPYEVLSDAEMVEFSETTAPLDEGSLERWVEIGDTDADGRIIQMYGASFVYCDAADVPEPNRPVLNGTPFPYYEETITFIWHQVPFAAEPSAMSSSMLNKINEEEFAGYPARTLMYIGRKRKRTRLPDNAQTRALNIEYRFKYNRFQWDHLPDPTRGGEYFKVVKKSDTAQILFEEDDFRKLFRPV